MRTMPRNTTYEFVQLTDLAALQNDPSGRMFRKEIVATVCLSAHQVLPNSGWLSRFAVHPKYADTRMANDMIESVVKFCLERAYDSLEIVTTECQFKDRETFIQTGYVKLKLFF